MPSIESIADAVGPVEGLTSAERRAVLEIAYAVVACDHDINEKERAALHSIARKLAGSDAVAEDDAAALLRRFDGARDGAVPAEHLRRIAEDLTTPAAREVAYKAACALALADDVSSDGEFEIDLELIDALALPQAEADRLAAEVARTLK